MNEPAPSAGVYSISVAAELTGLTVRSLRLYERHGLLRPVRTQGGTRRFSQDDLRRARRIAELTDQGVNLPGIGKILDLEQDTTGLQADKAALQADNAALQADNTRLQADRGRRPTASRHPSDDTNSARRSRRSPTQGRHDQSTRPG